MARDFIVVGNYASYLQDDGTGILVQITNVDEKSVSYQTVRFGVQSEPVVINRDDPRLVVASFYTTTSMARVDRDAAARRRVVDRCQCPADFECYCQLLPRGAITG